VKGTRIETLEFEVAEDRVAEVERIVERCGGHRIAPEEYLADGGIVPKKANFLRWFP
jgi:hypothetical protein